MTSSRILLAALAAFAPLSGLAAEFSAAARMPVAPALKRLDANVLLEITLDLPEAATLSAAEFTLSGSGATAREVDKFILASVETLEKATYEPAPWELPAPNRRLNGAPAPFATTLRLAGNLSLKQGPNLLRLFATVPDSADLDRRLTVACTGLTLNGKRVKPDALRTPPLRFGVALRKSREENCHTYRIPGLVATPKGALIAVYDNRYKHWGDLPAHVDVGFQRSTDGGRTWSPMKIAMDMGNESEKGAASNGIGDPAILADPKTGKVWIAALWSHGNRSWHGSGPGLTPKETGQFVLVSSDDDGKSWSKPINITAQVKNPQWTLFFQGPGAGIAMRDGTLVFPAQFQIGEKKPDGKIDRTPYSNLIYSKDNGKTWKTATGAKSNTTEAQAVELSDGSLMLNMRDNRGGFRSVAVTKDLGASWTEHPSSRKALKDPVCQASILRADLTKAKSPLLFSNAAGPGRTNMTIKASSDDGDSWNSGLLLNEGGAAYSCLAMADARTAAIVYEANQANMIFQRIPLAEILDADKAGPIAPKSAVAAELAAKKKSGK